MKRIKKMVVRGRGAVGSRIDNTSYDSFPVSKNSGFGPFRPGERVIDTDSSSSEERRRRRKRKREKKHKKHKKEKREKKRRKESQ